MQERQEDYSKRLVVAMTRPAMIGGFTMSSLGFSLFIPAFLGLLFKTMVLFLLAIPLLAFSYWVCLKDVYFFEIALAAMNLKACPNKPHWGCRSYAPK